MKKFYEEPKAELVMFQVMDVIAASVGGDDDDYQQGENETPGV